MGYRRSNSSRWSTLLGNLSVVTDIVLLFGFFVVAEIIVLEQVASPVVRALFGIPLVILVPGYALTAAAFPKHSHRSMENRRRFAGVGTGSLDWVERLSLSFGMSIVVLILLAIALSVLGLGFTVEPILYSLAVFVAVGFVVAVVRRLRVPPRQRVTISIGNSVSSATDRFRHGSPVANLLSVVLVAVILVATASLFFAVATPADGESYTTMTVLTENETGEYVTGDYPTNLSAGESGSVVVGVENNEGERVQYSIVAEVQTVQRTNDSLTILDRRPLGTTNQTVGAGETWYADTTFTAQQSNGTRRVVYMLYRDGVPDDSSIESAYDYGQVWISWE